MDRYHYTYATVDEAYEAADALAQAAGLPRKGRNVGPGKHVEAPDSFSEGAPGWTEELVPVFERDGAGPPNEAYGIDRDEVTDKFDAVDVNHPVHGAIKTPGKKASKKKGMWKKKARKAQRPKKGGGKKVASKKTASKKVATKKVVARKVGPALKKKATTKKLGGGGA